MASVFQVSGIMSRAQGSRVEVVRTGFGACVLLGVVGADAASNAIPHIEGTSMFRR